MDSKQGPALGSVTWRDLTVPDADAVRDFYSQVVGWKSTALSMGEYDDFCMNLPGAGETVAGICHARGSNANLPPQWLIYITVDNLDKSIERCRELGGDVLDGPRSLGEGTFCVIRDPAGAVAALYQKT